MIGQLKKNVRKSDRSYSSVMFTESHNSNRNELTEASTPKEEKIQNDVNIENINNNRLAIASDNTLKGKFQNLFYLITYSIRIKKKD